MRIHFEKGIISYLATALLFELRIFSFDRLIETVGLPWHGMRVISIGAEILKSAVDANTDIRTDVYQNEYSGKNKSRHEYSFDAIKNVQAGRAEQVVDSIRLVIEGSQYEQDKSRKNRIFSN